jgi:hypothetical protein
VSVLIIPRRCDASDSVVSVPCTMSIIRYTEIDLTQLIEESNIIVEVQFVENFSELLPLSTSAGERNLPDFVKKGCVFKIVSVLKNPDKIKIPDTIRVAEEQWRRSFNQHKETYGGGRSKSYDVKKYESDITALKKAEILFLYHFQGMYELTAKDSFVSKAVADKLSILLGT